MRHEEGQCVQHHHSIQSKIRSDFTRTISSREDTLHLGEDPPAPEGRLSYHQTDMPPSPQQESCLLVRLSLPQERAIGERKDQVGVEGPTRQAPGLHRNPREIN